VIKVRREDAIMSEDPPTDALEGVEVRKRIYTEQIVSEDRTPHDKERALSNDYLAPLDLNNYHTDKITNGYMNVYGPILAPLRSKPIKLLDLGGSWWGVPPALAGLFLERYDRRSGPKACNH